MNTPVGAPTLAQITPNMNQPRHDFAADPMLELAQSIRSGGLIQPIVIQPGDDYSGKYPYTIVAGERRWRASCALAVAQHRNPGDDETLANFVGQICGNVFGFVDTHRALLEVTPIAATITEPANGARLLIRATIENLHRTDLNPMELASAFQNLSAGGMSDAEIARALGLNNNSRSTIANTRRLVNLPADMQRAVIDNIISPSVALAYLPALDIKPHEIATGGLDNQPTFPGGTVPTPAALRKRLCNPEKYGRKLTRDDVRELVEKIKDRCTPAPCVDCGCNTKITEHHKIYTDPGHEIICGECYRKRKEAETHPRWCPNCRHETTLNTLQIDDWKQITCDECGQRFAGYNWRKDPPTDLSKIEYKRLVLDDAPASEPKSPPIDGTTGIIAVTRYCPECGTSRVMETSRIEKSLRSNCANCHAIYPADEWLKLPPIEKQYAVYPCHLCGEKKININTKTNTAECEGCGNEWDTLTEYHAERKAPPMSVPNEPPAAVIILDNPPPAPWEEQPHPATNGNGHQPTAAAQVDMVAKISQRFFIILDKIPPVWLPELDAWLDDVEAELLPQTELS